ncbi:MAG: Fic family protein [Thermaerobacter sp.]|nr:Fic family protein [Thermaerobacter sp.]
MNPEATLAAVDQKQRAIAQARPLPRATLLSLEDDFTIRYAYNTTAIEGNTLTLSETQVVLEDGIAIGGKTLREHLEVLNIRDALNWLREVVQQTEPVTDRSILAMHRIIMAGILKEEAGFYRRQPVYIRGASHLPPNWVKVPELMEDLSSRLEASPGGEHPVVFAATAHLELVRIHPFVDGNGRTARLLTNLLLMRSGYPPAMYSVGERAEYIDAIREADTVSHDRFIILTAQAVEFMQDRYLTMIHQVEEGESTLQKQQRKIEGPDLDL